VEAAGFCLVARGVSTVEVRLEDGDQTIWLIRISCIALLGEVFVEHYFLPHTEEYLDRL